MSLNSVLQTLTTRIATECKSIRTAMAALAVVQPGTMQMFAGTGVPTGYLECLGQSVSKTTYAALYNALVLNTTCSYAASSTTYTLSAADVALIEVGYNVRINATSTTVVAKLSSTTIQLGVSYGSSGSGVQIEISPHGPVTSTTFPVPSMQDKVPRGIGGGKNRVGEQDGSDSTTLTTAHLPSHQHGASGLTVTAKSGDNLTPAPNSTSSTWSNNNTRLATSGGNGGTGFNAGYINGSVDAAGSLTPTAIDTRDQFTRLRFIIKT